MVSHQTVGVHRPIESVPNAGQDIQKQAPVPIGEENRLAPVSATGHMVQRTGKFEAKGSGHALKSSSTRAKGKT